MMRWIRLTDLLLLAGWEAVTAIRISLKSNGLDKLISRITPVLKLSVLISSERSHIRLEDRLVPRKIIEEFDPGSA